MKQIYYDDFSSMDILINYFMSAVKTISFSLLPSTCVHLSPAHIWSCRADEHVSTPLYSLAQMPSGMRRLSCRSYHPATSLPMFAYDYVVVARSGTPCRWRPRSYIHTHTNWPPHSFSRHAYPAYSPFTLHGGDGGQISL